MKRGCLIILALLMGGCGEKSLFVLPKEPIAPIKKSYKKVGIKEIKLPNYLNDDKIEIIKSDGSIEYLKGYWADEPKNIFTNRLINNLRELLKNPNIKEYPWGFDNKENLTIVRVEISDIYYKDGFLYIKGIYDIDGKSRFFNIREKCEKNGQSLVKALAKGIDRISQMIATII
ncbi:MAG: hypothetical protein GXO02_01890 [Epsilonproteobacteria bacterium]|nr:hypothetical protein [Campylobacterota bacterium]